LLVVLANALSHISSELDEIGGGRSMSFGNATTGFGPRSNVRRPSSTRSARRSTGTRRTSEPGKCFSQLNPDGKFRRD
jgi:hypothetical protein